MKASGLRIGNIVDNNSPCKITGNDIFEMDEFEKRTGMEDNMYSPIPLTEEWLMKLGAKKHADVVYFPIPNLKSELHFEVYGNEAVATLKGQFCELILDRIRYVHKLQNLYYALTGLELNPQAGGV